MKYLIEYTAGNKLIETHGFFGINSKIPFFSKATAKSYISRLTKNNYKNGEFKLKIIL